MKVLSIGGSGRAGQLVIAEALKRGHSVTALVRKTSSLAARKALIVVEGDPRTPDDMDRAFEADPNQRPDVVIVTLASVRESDNPFAKPVSPPRMMTDSVATVIASAKKYGAPKVVVMQALGVGDSFPNLMFAMRLIVRHSNMARAYEDHDALDQLVKESNVNYVLVRPTRLAEGEAAPLKFYGNQGSGIGGLSTVTRGSVANFLVDAAETQQWDRQTPVISN